MAGRFSRDRSTLYSLILRNMIIHKLSFLVPGISVSSSNTIFIKRNGQVYKTIKKRKTGMNCVHQIQQSMQIMAVFPSISYWDVSGDVSDVLYTKRFKI